MLKSKGRLLPFAVIICSSLSERARAQSQRPSANPSAATPPSAAPQVQNTVEPKLPDIDDPMLAPPAPPPHVLNDWREALRILRDNSTALKTARARIEQARGQAKITLAPALPTLVGNANAQEQLLRGQITSTNVTATGTTTTTTVLPSGLWTAGATLNVPLLASRTWYDYRTARDAVDNAAIDEKEIEREQVANLAAQIVNVVTNERLVEVSRVSLASALSTLDLTKRRATLGASSTVDVLRIDKEVSDARGQLVAANESLIRAREALGDALGSPEAWGVMPDIQLDALANDAATSCMREAGVELRPDVRSATAALHVAERNVKSVDFAFVPTVNGFSTLTYYSNPNASPNHENTSWIIGATLNWQIYDGGLRYGQRVARRGDFDVSAQNLADVRRHAIIEVTQAVRGVTVAESNLTVSRQSRDIASETARLTRIAYVNGTGTSFDLVDSTSKLRAAELDLTIKEFQVLQAKITALLAMATCNV